MSSKSDIFLHEFVVVFGFFGGLFTRVGVDPETELVKALLKILEVFVPSIGPFYPLILALIIGALTILSILGAYSLGGILGLVSVACAWVAGLIIIGGSIQSLIGIFFLFGAMFIGWYATENI